MRAWIEDVVVDETARGRGVGRARTIELTSRPSRVAANALYESMGLAIRDTNLYRFTALRKR